MAFTSASGARRRRDFDGGGGSGYGALSAPVFPFPDPPSTRFGLENGEGCPELDCLRDRLPLATLAAAERRAAAVGVGADQVLVAAGIVSEEAYLTAFAARHGIGFELLAPGAIEGCPVSGDRLIEAANTGILPIYQDGELVWVIAPRGSAARRLCLLLDQYPDLACRLRVTTSARLHRFIARHAGHALRHYAAGRLQRQRPDLSAAPRSGANHGIMVGSIAVALAIAIAWTLAPRATLLALNAGLALLFTAWIGLRLLCCLVATPPEPRSERIADHELPVYTVIAALYREATSIEPLLRAIHALDYPPEKLDLKIVLEADDLQTRRAAALLQSSYRFETIIAPNGAPRTKPKALNAALAFARGSFTVIYDAEDRPEPQQLRRALDAFRQGGARLACVQARLTIDNTDDGLLARLFTAEYAGQFDVFLPGVAALGLPIPLGGSSNHFRTAALKGVGAWDPWNVTEDADLGLRLARFGYRSATVASTTYEEAPARFGPWLRQRTRWFKGWIQTWCVGMRAPGRLMRDLGFGGFVASQLMIGGNVLAALVHPAFIAALIYWLVTAEPDPGNALTAALAAINIGVCVAGYLSSAAIGWEGLRQRRLQSSAWVLLLMPLHWLLLSLAAWRALYQFLRDPYRWEKTEHGLARTSRRFPRLPVRLVRVAGARRAAESIVTRKAA